MKTYFLLLRIKSFSGDKLTEAFVVNDLHEMFYSREVDR